MTDKLAMHTKDLVQENIEKIAQIFPSCVTETIGTDNTTHLAIDFDALKRQLSDDLVYEGKERYVFTWPEKSIYQHKASEPATDRFNGKEEYVTLRPYRDESVDFDNTQNIYIEGDNLNALKLLRETYLGQIKMIYIDPPYNTGGDFLYNDSFAISEKDYQSISGDYNQEGMRLVLNSTSNGRFHTDWLNKIYPRLLLAKDLLREDGIIFISIDDNELTNLKKICDEIFGEYNFIAEMVIDGTPKNDPIIVSTAHEYCLVYVRNYSIAKTKVWGVSNPIYEELLDIFDKNGSNYQKTSEEVAQYYKKNNLTGGNYSNYKFVDHGGIYRIGPIDDPQGSGPKDLRLNPRTGNHCAIPSRGWSCTVETWNDWVRDGLIEFPDDDTKLPAKKTYIKRGQLDVLRAYFKIQTRKDTDMLKNMFEGKKVFLFPKPLAFLETIVEACTSDGDIVLDFYSGSASTAHAVFNVNARDRKKRKFILVQLREDLEENQRHASGNRAKKSIQDAIDFCKAHNVPPLITEIAKERIRRSGAFLKSELSPESSPSGLDFGFRVLKIDSTNMNDVYYNPQFLKKDLLDYAADNIKSDRSGEDLLFQVMLDLGIELSESITRDHIFGKEVYTVGGGYLVACFDDSITDEIVTEIAKKKPTHVVFRDSSMADDSVAINFEQIFLAYSPDTKRRVI